jgi:hypothetical protein
MRSWVWMVVTTLCLIVLTGGCTKTDNPPSENKPQANPQDFKGRKDRDFPSPPPPIKMPPPK